MRTYAMQEQVEVITRQAFLGQCNYYLLTTYETAHCNVVCARVVPPPQTPLHLTTHHPRLTTPACQPCWAPPPSSSSA